VCERFCIILCVNVIALYCVCEPQCITLLTQAIATLSAPKTSSLFEARPTPRAGYYSLTVLALLTPRAGYYSLTVLALLTPRAGYYSLTVLALLKLVEAG
jgi:hypothetical protein